MPIAASEAPTEYQIGPAVPFAALHPRDKVDVLEFIHWGRYSKQGLTWLDQQAIQNNVAGGKLADRWLEGTSFLEPSQGPSAQRSAANAASDRIAADPGKAWDATFGAMISWEKAHVDNKVSFLATYAALYDVAFDRFARAVEEALGRTGPIAGEEWALRGQYDAARAALGHPDPAMDSFEALLDRYAGRQTKTPQPGKGQGPKDPDLDR